MATASHAAQARGGASDGQAAVGRDYDTSGVDQAHEPSPGGIPGFFPSRQDDRAHDRCVLSLVRMGATGSRSKYGRDSLIKATVL